MTTLTIPVLLSRHPPVEGSEGLCYGRQEMELRTGWEAQAAGLLTLARGAGCSVIYTSPSARCLSVARRLEAQTGWPLRLDDRLLELNFGQWEGLSWNVVPRVALDSWAEDPEGFSPPKGESGRALQERVQSFWADLVQAGEAALVISHGGPLRLLDGLAKGEGANLLAPSMPQGSSRLHYVSV